jgi:hypothetical protein
MFRIAYLGLLIGGLLAATGCNTPNGGTSDSTEEQVEAGGQNTTATVGTMDPTTGGANYSVVTIDTTIKSPRKELSGTVDGVPIKINYGSPAVNERTIYGDLVPYGKVWRTGANEATRITFQQDVMVGEDGEMIPAGTYSLFTLPEGKDDWTVIFNRTSDQWGAYDYDESEDVVRIEASSRPLSSMAERMDFAVEDNEVVLMWADRAVSFPVSATSR